MMGKNEEPLRFKIMILKRKKCIVLIENRIFRHIYPKKLNHMSSSTPSLKVNQKELFSPKFISPPWLSHILE